MRARQVQFVAALPHRIERWGTAMTRLQKDGANRVLDIPQAGRRVDEGERIGPPRPEGDEIVRRDARYHPFEHLAAFLGRHCRDAERHDIDQCPAILRAGVDRLRQPPRVRERAEPEGALRLAGAEEEVSRREQAIDRDQIVREPTSLVPADSRP